MSLFAVLRRRLEPRALPKDSNMAGPPAQDRPVAVPDLPCAESAGPGPVRRSARQTSHPCGRRESHGGIVLAGTFHREVFQAVREALLEGGDPVSPATEAGRRLADDGVALPEALDGLYATSCAAVRQEPAFAVVRALCQSWAESSLTYLHSLSCEDPLTGLASMPHLRSRLGELYREAEVRGSCVSDTHALVVVEPVVARGASSVDRELRLVDVAECLRIVFCGSEVLGRVGGNRAAALVVREKHLPEQVETVRSLISHWRSEPDRDHPPARVWIEGLPSLSEWSGRVLDELARP